MTDLFIKGYVPAEMAARDFLVEKFPKLDTIHAAHAMYIVGVSADEA